MVLWSYSSVTLQMAPRYGGSNPSGGNIKFQQFKKIAIFQKHDVIYDHMETWLQQDFNFEEQWGQLVDLIGFT